MIATRSRGGAQPLARQLAASVRALPYQRKTNRSPRQDLLRLHSNFPQECWLLYPSKRDRRSRESWGQPGPAGPSRRQCRGGSSRSRGGRPDCADPSGSRGGRATGYLPGDIGEKLAPYLRPLNDALNERLGGRRVKQLMTEGAIEIAPIGFMRGRALNNAFIVIDEAQNCTYGQIKMILTRLGWHSTMVVTGDPDQSDLLDGLSGLAEIARRLEPIANVAVLRLGEGDIVRHPLVGEMQAVL